MTDHETMSRAKFPLPTICTHPRERWVSEGSGSWPAPADGSPAYVISGYRCLCGTWISKEAADDEFRARLRTDFQRFEQVFQRLADA
jgi:hypothetical protein